TVCADEHLSNWLRDLLRCMSPQVCWFLDAGNKEPSTGSPDRRPKSAKARSRGKLGTGSAAGAMRIYAGAALDGKRDASTRRRAMSAYRGTEDRAVDVSAGA